MSATDDRRGFTRVPFQVAVSLKSDHGTLVFGDIWDISLSGLYVTGTAQFPRGCSCEVDMELDGPEGKVHLHMRGRVARLDHGGMAIEFREMGLDSYLHLRNLVLYNTTEPDRLEKELKNHLGLRPLS